MHSDIIRDFDLSPVVGLPERKWSGKRVTRKACFTPTEFEEIAIRAVNFERSTVGPLAQLDEGGVS